MKLIEKLDDEGFRSIPVLLFTGIREWWKNRELKRLHIKRPFARCTNKTQHLITFTSKKLYSCDGMWDELQGIADLLI